MKHISFTVYFEGTLIKVLNFLFKDVEILTNILLTELLRHDHHEEISIPCSSNLIALSFAEN